MENVKSQENICIDGQPGSLAGAKTPVIAAPAVGAKGHGSMRY
jgi:hypothetical protein